MEELKEQIKVVVEARQILKEVKESKDKAFKEWEQDNNELLAHCALGIQVVTDAEVKLRELTLKAYAETLDKAPMPGVGIREVTKFEYDGKEALQWAIEHKMALKLDEAKFKNHVKADPPDFVKVSTEPQATISPNLEEVKGE